MFTVDTNILVRILIDDNKQLAQVETARRFAKKHKKLFVLQIVQVELVWVLDSAHLLAKKEIIYLLKHLYENEAFVLQNEASFHIALHLFENSNVDFSDCLILAESYREKYLVATFDKKFSKLNGVHLISD